MVVAAGLRVVMKYVLLLCIAWSFGGAARAAVVPVPVPVGAEWAEWNRSDEQNFATIDHGVWDRLLRRYVVEDHKSGINRFRYGDTIFGNFGCSVGLLNNRIPSFWS